MATPIWVPNTPIIVPVNLRYLDANGDPVTQLYPLEYLTLVGQDLNALITSTNYTNAIVSGNTSQIAILTAAVATIPPVYNTPTILTQCLTPSGSTVLPIDQVLNLLVTDWCGFLSVTGSQAALATSITQECINLNAAPSFGNPGASMSAITGWKSTPSTIADTITNLWLTECDSRAGIQTALDAVTPTCAQVIINFAVFLNDWQTGFNFYFDGYSFIPSGYTDNGSIIKILDTQGNTYMQSVDIVAQSTNPTALNISISGTTLLASSAYYTVHLISNVRNTTTGTTCIKDMITSVSSGNIQSNTVTTSCCPDIGNYAATTASGTTALTIVSTLSYTPRYAMLIPKNVYTATVLLANGVFPYYSYTLGGFVIHTLSPFGSAGAFDADWIAYR